MPHQLGQPAAASSTGRPPEGRRRLVLRPALHARVVVAEQLEVGDAEDLAAGLELVRRSGTTTALVVPGLAGLDPAGGVPQLAVGAGHQDGAHALGGVTGQDAARPDRLVVGMGVHGHEGEG